MASSAKHQQIFAALLSFTFCFTFATAGKVIRLSAADEMSGLLSMSVLKVTA